MEQNKHLEQIPYIEIPLVGKNGEGKVALVDADYDGEYFSQYQWTCLPNGYVVAYSQHTNISDPKTGEFIKRENPFIYLHRLVASPPPRAWVKHLDGNLLNNRSCNIVCVTPSYSALTRKGSKLSRSIAVV